MKRQNFRPSLARRINQRSQIIFYRLKQKKLIRKLIGITFLNSAIETNVNYIEKLKSGFLRKRKRFSDSEIKILSRFNYLTWLLMILYLYIAISMISTIVKEIWRDPNSSLN